MLVEDVWRDVIWGDGREADEFVVMPNHIHGIVWLAGTGTVGAQQPGRPLSDSEDRNQRHVSQSDRAVAAPLRAVWADWRVEPGSLAAVVRTFKSAAAKRINRLRNTPGAAVWQRNYDDRVIRNERELLYVRRYVRDNPIRWGEDKNNPANFLRHPP